MAKTTGSALKLGFERPVQDSQAVFRTVMMAMACPGTIRDCPVAIDPPGKLSQAATALALALCDFETPVWLDDALASDAAVADYLRFHTGAPLVGDPTQAQFAFLSDGAALPDFERFSLGTLAYPDRSTTLVVDVATLGHEGGWTLSGPGIAGKAHLSAGPLPPDILTRLEGNRSLFPRGVDMVFVSGARLAALPRSVHVEA